VVAAALSANPDPNYANNVAVAPIDVIRSAERPQGPGAALAPLANPAGDAKRLFPGRPHTGRAWRSGPSTR
jgi:hypothetical protein